MTKAVASEDQPRRSKSEDMPFTGVLAASDLEKLQDKFSDMVVCPGVVSGAHADALDRLFIPGATSSFNKAREAMDRWKSKAETDERWNWWPGVMKEKGIKPITGKMIINGLDRSKWEEYRDKYKTIHKARLAVRRKQAAEEKRLAEQAERDSP